MNPRSVLQVPARDGTKLFVQDWGSGRPLLFLAAWTFNSAIWGSYIAALNAKGFRCIAPDRRGHGRSDMPAIGYDIDTLADDLAAIIEQRDLRDVTLVTHSMGSIEAVNYLARHGSERIAKLVLLAPTTPFLVQTEDNPDGVPQAAIEADNAAFAQDFPKWIAANEAPFFMPDITGDHASLGPGDDAERAGAGRAGMPQDHLLCRSSRRRRRNRSPDLDRAGRQGHQRAIAADRRQDGQTDQGQQACCL